jgi:hypothetical protein
MSKPKMQKEEDHGLGVGTVEEYQMDQFLDAVFDAGYRAVKLQVSQERFFELCHAAYDSVGGTR